MILFLENITKVLHIGWCYELLILMLSSASFFSHLECNGCRWRSLVSVDIFEARCGATVTNNYSRNMAEAALKRTSTSVTATAQEDPSSRTTEVGIEKESLSVDTKINDPYIESIDYLEKNNILDLFQVTFLFP